MLLGWQRELQLLNDAWISHLIRESTLRALLLRRSSCRWAACVSHRFIFRFIRYACQRGHNWHLMRKSWPYPSLCEYSILRDFSAWSCAWWTKDSQSPPQVHTDCILSMSWPTVQNPNFFLVYGCDCSNLSLVWNERLICNNEVVEKIEQVRAGERTVFSFFIAKCLKARREGLKKAFEFTSTKYLPVSLRFE